MKVHLMHDKADFNPDRPLPVNAEELIQDLHVDAVLSAMAVGDDFLLKVAKAGVLASVGDVDGVLYRQDVLKDCLRHEAIVKKLYSIALRAIEADKKHYFGLLNRYPSGLLNRSIDVLLEFIQLLRQLRDIADEDAGRFQSQGFTQLFAMLQEELSDDYFAEIDEHLKQLKFRDGIWLSATLGPGNKGAHYLLLQPHETQSGLLQRLFPGRFGQGYTFHIADRDESASRALSNLRDRGLHLVANALTQSVDAILSFFVQLRSELGFYLGCVNLHEQLTQISVPVCFPKPLPAATRRRQFAKLCDVSLALHLEGPVVGNTLTLHGKELVVITGANQGGKSTFLRSLGLFQLMLQCGMFVAAESAEADLCSGVFTHFTREEDETMTSGKFDEELNRMTDLVTQMQPQAMLLCNESFASTDEREGSEIAQQVALALVESSVTVVFVTHFYRFAHGCYELNMENALYLRAERQADGHRTFRVRPGEPLETSYGTDLYQRIFAAPLDEPSP